MPVRSVPRFWLDLRIGAAAIAISSAIVPLGLHTFGVLSLWIIAVSALLGSYLASRWQSIPFSPAAQRSMTMVGAISLGAALGPALRLEPVGLPIVAVLSAIATQRPWLFVFLVLIAWIASASAMVWAPPWTLLEARIHSGNGFGLIFAGLALGMFGFSWKNQHSTRSPWLSVGIGIVGLSTLAIAWGVAYELGILVPPWIACLGGLAIAGIPSDNPRPTLFGMTAAAIVFGSWPALTEIWWQSLVGVGLWILAFDRGFTGRRTALIAIAVITVGMMYSWPGLPAGRAAAAALAALLVGAGWWSLSTIPEIRR